MTPFTVYDDGTGRILRSGRVARAGDVALQAGAGEAVVAGQALSDATSYWDGSAFASRPAAAFDKAAITADGVDEAVLDLGEAFTAQINGVDQVVADGSLEVMSSAEGEFVVVVDHFPFQRIEQTVVAT